MPEPTPDPLALEALALRYAAGHLSPAAAAGFEARLAADQVARDALAEAVRLSAAALGQAPPAPDRSFRLAIRDRLRPATRWPRWLARRAYRGHPLTWVGLGAGLVAAAVVAGFAVSDPPAAVVAEQPLPAPASVPAAPKVVAPTPLPQEREAVASRPPTMPAAADPLAASEPDDAALKAAEIWADLSTPDHAEKTHEEDARRRQWLRDLHHGRPAGGFQAP